MAKQVQLRRGTTVETDVFTGALAEATVDLTKKTLVVHDGETPGGFPLLRDDLSNISNFNGIISGFRDEVQELNSRFQIGTVRGDASGTYDTARPLPVTLETGVFEGDSLFVRKTPTAGEILDSPPPLHRFVVAREDSYTKDNPQFFQAGDIDLPVEELVLQETVTDGSTIGVESFQQLSYLSVAPHRILLNVEQERDTNAFAKLNPAPAKNAVISSITVDVLKDVTVMGFNEPGAVYAAINRLGESVEFQIDNSATNINYSEGTGQVIPIRAFGGGDVTWGIEDAVWVFQASSRSSTSISQQAGSINLNATNISQNTSDITANDTAIANVQIQADSNSADITNSVQFNDVSGQTRLIAGPGGSEFSVEADQVKVGAGTVFESGFDPSGLKDVQRQVSAPATRTDGTPLKVMDIWIKEGNDDKFAYWSGTSWVSLNITTTEDVEGIAGPIADDSEQAAKDQISQELGFIDFADLVSVATLSDTLILGGFVRTSVIDVDDLFSNTITVTDTILLGANGVLESANFDQTPGSEAGFQLDADTGEATLMQVKEMRAGGGTIKAIKLVNNVSGQDEMAIGSVGTANLIEGNDGFTMTFRAGTTQLSLSPPDDPVELPEGGSIDGVFGIGVNQDINYRLRVAGDVRLDITTATSATAGSNGGVPSQVAIYGLINVSGADYKIPLYNV